MKWLIRSTIYRKMNSPASKRPTDKTSGKSPAADTGETKQQGEFRERLNAVLKMNGIDGRGQITKLHEELEELSWSTARSLIVGGSYPRAETLMTLQRVKGLSIDWLLTGRGEPWLAGSKPSSPNSWDAVLFINLASEEKGEVVLAPGLANAGLSVHKVTGAEMAPDLNEGDYVLLNANIERIEAARIYALRGTGDIIFRRIEQSLVGAGWRLVPRNPDMAPEHVLGIALPGEPATRSLVRVIGKVEKKILAKA
jgi:Peptidase S24-like